MAYVLHARYRLAITPPPPHICSYILIIPTFIHACTSPFYTCSPKPLIVYSQQCHAVSVLAAASSRAVRGACHNPFTSVSLKSSQGKTPSLAPP